MKLKISFKELEYPPGWKSALPSTNATIQHRKSHRGEVSISNAPTIGFLVKPAIWDLDLAKQCWLSLRKQQHGCLRARFFFSLFSVRLSGGGEASP